MGYTDDRSYIGFSALTIAAQNAVSSASGAIVAGATTATAFTNEPTFICSIAGLVTATPTTPPAGVKFFVVVGTNTSTAGVTPSPASTLAQSSGSSCYQTFVPPVAIAGGTVFTIGLVCTGTANATETIGATSLYVGVAPQYV